MSKEKQTSKERNSWLRNPAVAAAIGITATLGAVWVGAEIKEANDRMAEYLYHDNESAHVAEFTGSISTGDQEMDRINEQITEDYSDLLDSGIDQ